MIIEVGNEKGGVGKSTIAITVAAWLANQKYSVVLVDTDSQQTSSKWGELRTHFGASHDFLIVDKTVDATATILKLSEQYDVVVVDVGARDYDRMIDLARIVDLWIAPTKTGQSDLESTMELTYAFEKANSKHKNGKIPLVTMLNAVPGAWNSSEGELALEALTEATPNTVTLKSFVRDRKVWRDAHKLGKTIFEMPRAEREKAEAEFEAVMKEALKHYEKFQKGASK